MLFQLVAAALLELLEELRRPRGFRYFVAVVEECARVGGTRAFEGGFDMLQIIRHRLLVEVVDDQTFTAWCCTLDLHDTIANVDGNDAPLCLIDIFDFLFQRILLHLVIRGFAHGGKHGEWRPCQLSVSDIFGNVDGCITAIYLTVCHDFLQAAVLLVLGRNVERNVCHSAASTGSVNEDDFAGTLLQWNPRTTKRPASASSHIYLDA